MTEAELAVLIQTYSKPLIRYATGILKDVESAKDIVQECFLKVFPHRLGEIHVPGWLYREVRNRSIDLWRQRCKIDGLTPETEENLRSDHPDPLDGLEAREGTQMLAASLKGLSARDQEVLRLKYGEELSYEQIGAALGLTATNVGYILSQAIKSLRSAAAPSPAATTERSVKKYGE